MTLSVLTASASETIDPRTGSLHLTQTDLVVDASPVSLVVSRSLQQADPRAWQLGRGWRTNWESRLHGSFEEAFLVESGAATLFRPLATHSELTSTSGDRLRLEADGRAVHRGLDGVVTEFALDRGVGRPIRYTLPNGDHVTLTYSPDGPLRRIDGPRGTSLELTMDDEGRLARIDASTGSHVQYDYSQGRLAEVRRDGGPPERFHYNDDGLLARIERPSSGWVDLTYDERGRVTHRRWPNGAEEGYAYDVRGAGCRITDAAGGVTELRWREDGRRQEIVDPLGRVKTIDLDEHLRPLTVHDAGGSVTRLVYDDSGRISEIREGEDPATHVEYRPGTSLVTEVSGPDEPRAVLQYDAGGNLLTEKVGDALVQSCTYDSQGRLASWQGSDSSRVRFSYYPNGPLHTLTDELDHTTTCEYDERGNLSAVVDPSGNPTRWSYDGQGRVVSETDALGHATRYTYDDAGRLVGVRDPMGATEAYGYDELGRLTSVTGPAGGVTRVEYAADGRVSAIVEPGGRTRRFERDLAGRLVQEVDSLGGETRYRYDGRDRLVETTDPRGGRWRYSYSEDGLSVETTDPLGGVTRASSDRQGRLTSVVDPLGRVRRFEYDAAGNLTGVRGPTGSTVSLTYDDAGFPSEVHTPDGRSYRFAHDGVGNPVTVVDPAGAETRRGFDPEGRLLWEAESDGTINSFRYDELGRLVRKTRADGTEVRFEYDAVGNLTRADDGRFPVLLAYDDAGWVVRREYPAIRVDLSYGYDSEGRLAEFVDPEGQRFEYAYDDQSRLAAVRLPDGSRLSFGHDASGRITVVDYPNGLRKTIAYDLADRPVAIVHVDSSGAERIAWRYDYDGNGNLTRVVDAQGRETSYRYDEADRLIEERGPAGTVRYDYRANGDRKTVRIDDQVVDYSYDDAGRLIAAGRDRFRYDRRGRLVRRTGEGGVTGYTWDADDHLTAVTQSDGSVVRYGYAPTGERIWREDGEGRTWLVGDGVNLLAEIGEDLQVLRAYWHAPGIDRPMMMWLSGQPRFYHTDLLGSVAALTDVEGHTVASYLTDAFGRLRDREGTSANPFVFTARFFEADTGLYFHRARVYDPVLGRFLSPDPVWPSQPDPEGASRYAYVGNRPTQFTDPLGLDSIHLSELLRDPFGPHVLEPRKPWGQEQLQLSDRKWAALVERERRIFAQKNPVAWRTERKYAHSKAAQILDRRIREAPRGAPPRKIAQYVRVGQRGELPVREDFPFGMSRQEVKLRIDEVARQKLGLGPRPPEPDVVADELARMARARNPTFVGRPGGPPPPVQPPRLNPGFRGSPSLEPTRGDWRPIRRSPLPEGGTSAASAPQGWHGKFTKTPTLGQAGTLTFLLTTEMILRCRNQGLTLGECSSLLIKNARDNGYWTVGAAAGVTVLVATAGPAAAVVGTVVVTVGGLAKAVNDVAAVYYEYSSAEQAAAELQRVLQERSTWTARNVMLELTPKLSQLRAKIDRSAADLGASCGRLEALVSEAAGTAREAERLTAEVRHPQAIPGDERAPRFAARLKASWDRLEVLEARMDTTVGALRAAHDQAGRLVRQCESQETADRIVALIGDCESRGREAAQILDGAGDAKVTYDFAAEKVDEEGHDLQADLMAASEARDQLSALFETLPDSAVAEAEAQRGAAALDLLTEPHPSLLREIRALELAFGDPKSLDPGVARHFRELEERLESHRSLVDSCDPQALHRLYVDHLDQVLGSRMRAQNLIDHSESAFSMLSSDRAGAGGILSDIRALSTEASTLLAAARELGQQARDCVARAQGGDAGPRDDRPEAIAASTVNTGERGAAEIPSASSGQETSADETKPPPAIAASSARAGPPAKEEVVLVWANLDLELDMDRYGIYQVLDHLRDSDIIVRDRNGEREIQGKAAVNFLQAQGYVAYRNTVGFVATDKLKQFLREAEERADAAGGGSAGRSSPAPPGLAPSAKEESAEGSSDTLLGVSGDEFEKIKRVTDRCREEDRPEFDRCNRECDGLRDLSARRPCWTRCQEQSDRRQEACYERLKQ